MKHIAGEWDEFNKNINIEHDIIESSETNNNANIECIASRLSKA